MGGITKEKIQLNMYRVNEIMCCITT
jgi:hypothetical protein